MIRRQRNFILILSLIAIAVSAGSSLAITPRRVVNRGVIAGKVMVKGNGPLSGGQVIFFSEASGPVPDIGSYERTPDIVRDIGEDGRFSVDLPAGRYYLGAVKRQSGETIGPPVEGDYVWRSMDKKGRPRAYLVRAGRRIDIGVAQAEPLRPEVLEKRPLETVIEGVVIDMDGNPVADAVVVAFTTPSLKGKPVFISEKTDKAGHYLLRVTEGTYYLRARNVFASGPPEPGQIMGYYGEGASAPVTIKKGQRLRDVNFRVVLFPGRGPFSGS